MEMYHYMPVFVIISLETGKVMGCGVKMVDWFRKELWRVYYGCMYG